MKFHSTVVFVRDIKKSKDFYTRLLGFSVEHDFGKNIILSSGLTLWEVLPGHIIDKELNTKNESNRFELYFENHDIGKIFNTLDKAGIRFLHKIHEEPWGQRTFRFFDPDGHLIEIGEPLEVFVANMSKKGVTETRISEKTGIPIETIQTLLKNDN
ncbi:MAG: VOC family protein [Bacteroidales bacterium]|nr:VOC family protein [Bacteroidales bacterium]